MLKQYTEFARNYKVKENERESWLSLIEAAIDYFDLEAMVLVGKPTTTLVADEYAYERIAHMFDVASKEPLSIEEFFMDNIVITGDNVRIDGDELVFKESLTQHFPRKYNKEDLVDDPSILLDLDIISAPSHQVYPEAENEADFRYEYNDFYFTFGMGQSYADKIQHVKALDYEDARDIMFETYGDRWAFQYTGDDIEDELKCRNKRAEFLPTLYPGDVSLQKLACLEKLAADYHNDMLSTRNGSTSEAVKDSEELMSIISLAMPAQFAELPLESYRALALRLSRRNNIDRKFFAGAYEHAIDKLGLKTESGKVIDTIEGFAFKQAFQAESKHISPADAIKDYCRKEGVEEPEPLAGTFMIVNDKLAELLSSMIDSEDGKVEYYKKNGVSGLIFTDNVSNETYITHSLIAREGSEVTQFDNWEATYRFLQLYKRRVNNGKENSKGDSI